MRYTTARFGEVTRLLGDFESGRTLGQVTMTLIDLATGSLVPLADDDCTELVNSAVSGFSTYAWSTSNITTPALVQTEYLYLMEDSITGLVARGKFIVGGFPDESARRRYENQVHLTSTGTNLPTLGTVGPESLTFATGATDTITRGSAWPAAFAVGRRVQLSGTALNDGVTTPITSITGGGTILNFAAGAALEFNGAFQAETVATTAVVKSYVFDAGTEENPVIDSRDALQILAELQLREMHIHGGHLVSIDFPVDDIKFTGNDQFEDSIEFLLGASHNGCRLDHLTIYGPDLNGRLVCTNCVLDADGVVLTGVQGEFTDCALKDTIQIAAGGEFVGTRVSSRTALSTVIDMGAAGASSFLAGSVQGVFNIRNMNHAGDLVGMSVAGTLLDIDASNTAGQISLIGYGETLTATPGGGVVFLDYLIRGSQLQTIRQVGMNSVASRARINIGNGTTDQWLEERYAWRENQTTDITVYETFQLFDQAGVAIAGDHTAGNNPLFDPTRMIAERRRV